MADPVSIGVSVLAVGVSSWAAWTAHEALKIAQAEYHQREAERNARAQLFVQVEPTAQVDADGAIRVRGVPIGWALLKVTIGNAGNRAADRTIVSFYAAESSGRPPRWSEADAEEIEGGDPPVHDELTLADDDGKQFKTFRIARTLDSVSRLGETLYVLVDCWVHEGGRRSFPVRVHLRSEEGGEAETDYMVRLVHVRDHA